MRITIGRILLCSVVVLGASVSAQQPIFRAGIRLVETNVVVHDKKDGKPVADLTTGDFKIFEDGKEQKIEVFAVETDAAVATPAATPTPAAAETVFSNRRFERSVGNVTVIVFDRLNSSFEDQARARDEILKILVKTPATDRVALYVLESDVVTVLHDFTNDASRLVRVLSKYVGDTSAALEHSDEKMPYMAPIGLASVDAETTAWLERTMLMVSEVYLRRRAELTTSAFESIADHLAGVPGRKNLVWVSGAFPMVFNTDHGLVIMNKEVTRATRAINNANIAVYPVDIRGLVGAFNSTNPSALTERNNGAAVAPQAFTTMATTHPSQDTMRTVAEDTGGRAYMNTNAIGEATRRAIDDSRVSYVLGYYSTRPAADTKFRKIEVKVNRNGVDVRHRGGYMALPPPVHKDSKARLESLGRVLRSPIEATNIALSAEIQRDNGAPANEGVLVIKLDAGALTWEQKKDLREGAIDIVLAQSTPKGEYYTIKETSVNLSADPERFKQLMEEGFTLSSKFTQRPDTYRLHVVIADATSQAVGSLVIPIQ